MKGPGKLLGYCALHKKIREIHGLKVPRDLVYAMMAEVDPTGLQERAGVGRRRRARKKYLYRRYTPRVRASLQVSCIKLLLNRSFHCFKGSDWTMSLDGHDKLCGYQKATFPLCIYGGMGTYSERIQFLRIWTSNNPKIVGRYYLEYQYESRGECD